MDKEIKIKIGADGKVEIDSTVFEDCKDIGEHFAKILGTVESFVEKDDYETLKRIKIDKESK